MKETLFFLCHKVYAATNQAKSAREPLVLDADLKNKPVKFYLADVPDDEKHIEQETTDSSSEPSEDEDNKIARLIESQLDNCSV
jgi:hypothetical protein